MSSTKYTTPEQIEEMHQEIQREKDKMSGRAERSSLISLTLKITSWLLFLGIVFMLVSTIISINMAKSRGEVPSVLGFYLFSIESGSMEPTLNIGTLILSRKTEDPSGLKESQIVTFKTLSGAIVTHRIVDVIKKPGGSTVYQTKGDNPKNSPDAELLTSDRVIAVLIAKIPLT